MHDIAQRKPERVKAMAAAYDKWWDDLYPVMIKRGGDDELMEMKNKRTQESAKNRWFMGLLPKFLKKN